MGGINKKTGVPSNFSVSLSFRFLSFSFSPGVYRFENLRFLRGSFPGDYFFRNFLFEFFLLIREVLSDYSRNLFLRLLNLLPWFFCSFLASFAVAFFELLPWYLNGWVLLIADYCPISWNAL